MEIPVFLQFEMSKLKKIADFQHNFAPAERMEQKEREKKEFDGNKLFRRIRT